MASNVSSDFESWVQTVLLNAFSFVKFADFDCFLCSGAVKME